MLSATMLSNLQILIDAPIFNVQLLFNGLMVGAIFALAAYGLALGLPWSGA
jgi:branched-chain amino acid transport system permease protein